MTISVLVVDDEALLRTAFTSLIEAEDDLRVVSEAADGKQAVKLAARLAPDVVLMDVRMPVMDGIEATRLIAGAETASAPRVLILTTFDLDKYVFEALRAGASGGGPCPRQGRIASGVAVREDGLNVTLAAGPAREQTAEINRRLVEAGICVYGLRQTHPRLKDWFLSVTSRLGEEQ